MHAQWTSRAIQTLDAEAHRSADTHLIRLDLPAFPGIPLYLKDESVHPTGSLKHRLARSLFLYALCNGWLEQGRAVVEASSGSTAISEAYFARLLELPFFAVMPRSTSRDKIAQIEFFGGHCHLIDDTDVYGAAQRLSDDIGGHYMDQFTYAERATDWRGNNNIAESIFRQMQREPDPAPRWIVVPAGTGGTSATIGRYIRYRGGALDRTQLAVVDPEHSVFYDYYHQRDPSLQLSRGSRIEGIGRPRVEPSFMPGVIDRMLRVPDAASIAALGQLEALLGRRCGGSTGTNLVGALQLMAEMKARGEHGPVVTLICDGGDRYRGSYYDQGWLDREGLNRPDERARLETVLHEGRWID
ncbi:cysteine synthase A [Dyella jiangningensis]|uniref:PLP-dependent cysteine synthase family protein n=1 Tax=Dyella sp. AtDHG13 TaxID=1938897 RepID=UPI00088415A2|nr:PLP-dependent cysteine synthase family protein [Dyella sp. AtDHG13]PXV61490.1 cysteine synthase A [Dyella sp. AtDHG13]SDJ74038.1 cysteine synthase A [Dyella jiangningensis]